LFAIGLEPQPGNSAEAAVGRWRALCRLSETAAEQQLLSWVARRGELAQQATVLARLLDEKAKDLVQAEAQLRNEFGINPELFYEFDSAKREVLLVEGGQEGAAPTKKPVRRLETDKQVSRFVVLAAARRLAREQSISLRQLIKDRATVAERVEADMIGAFAVVRGRHYLYDPKVRTLYEKVNVAKGVDVGGVTP
jgi:pyruvate/2-oxoglutarate dehydrogenase complex dihydrolipoamide acyltransferase (E2) component